MKKLIFWAVTILLPFLFLLLLEAGLRIGGYNVDAQNLFIELTAKPEYLATNPAFVGRYFPTFVPQVAPSTFLKKKPKDTFRVFVFGGSSTQGFPYSFHQSFSAKLEQQLLLETQGLKIEVINLGMTAVNSYVIWDLRKRVMKYEPDAIIIYAGHNEYYGSFGVGSSQFGIGKSVSIKRLMIHLKNLSLYQLLENLLKPEDQPLQQRTMMARVVQEADIELGSDLYEAGLHQFRKNMSDFMDYYLKNEIPVFVGTVTSKLKDQPPLGENTDAVIAYKKGEDMYLQGQMDEALEEFIKAKELDEIRFRAPEEINTIIKELSKKYDAILVDIWQASKENSKSGIPDSSFFVDHLHPNWASHELIGELFFQKLKEYTLVGDFYLPNQLSTSIPISKFEKTFSTVPILRLNAGYPFTKGISEREENMRFRREYEKYLARSYVDSIAANAWRFQRDVALALTDVINHGSRNRDSLLVVQHYLQLAYWQLFNDNLLKKGVNYSINNRKFDAHSVLLLQLILNKHRDDPYFSNTLAALYLIHEDLNRAEYWLNHAENLNPDSPDPSMWYNFARLYAMKGDTVRSREAFRKYINTRNSQ